MSTLSLWCRCTILVNSADILFLVLLADRVRILRILVASFLLSVPAFHAALANEEPMPPDPAPIEDLEELNAISSAAPDIGSLTFTASAVPAAVETIPGTWIAQGPGPSTNGQTENFSPNNEVSGSVHTVAAHPSNA